MISEAFPYLRVGNAAAAIDFYQRAFGAVESFRLTEPGGRVGHAELKFGSFTVMLSDEFPEYGIFGPQHFGGTGSAIHLHVTNVDQMTEQAASAGAEVLMSPTDMFYGERAAKVRDPFGHEWLLGSQIEAITPEEMQRRYAELFSGQ